MRGEELKRQERKGKEQERKGKERNGTEQEKRKKGKDRNRTGKDRKGKEGIDMTGKERKEEFELKKHFKEL